jgi:hypothetical protein
MKKKKTLTKDKKNLTDNLNNFAENAKDKVIKKASEKDKIRKEKKKASLSELFDKWEGKEFVPNDFLLEVAIDSMESNVGYSSLFRQFQRQYIRSVAYYRSKPGGSLSIEEARAKAFHACTNKEEAKKIFVSLLKLPVEKISFIDIYELHSFAPRVAEKFWEYIKDEGRREFESGHLAANITFPTGYMKDVWNIARYIGVRDSFIEEWKPKGGIEISLIEMMAQSWFQWQYWLEQTVRRSQTRERMEDPDYSQWKAQTKRENQLNGWTEGYWNRPYVSEVEAIEHAVKMADRFNRMFMRTLRQLRDLRRYSVTINNANQVNIATDGGKQVNVSTDRKDENGKIIS